MSETLPAPLDAPIRAAQHQLILNIVRRAARSEILPRYLNLGTEDISEKTGVDDLVTAADKAAEAMITRALRISFPEALVVGEEAAAVDPALLGKIADAPLAFIIDPVDGTWNFAHGLGIFGVILAATQFGTPVFGLIYDPLADDWAMATAEGPARLETGKGRSRALEVAAPKDLADVTGFVPLQLFAAPKRAQLAEVTSRLARTGPLGCSAHEYRLIAQGKADFVLTPSLNPWDHAAGALICQRAGAHVAMLDGSPYSAKLHAGHLLVAPDHMTWNKLQKEFRFLLD
ncbi:MAG: inositol monophosphatase [Pseudomonadota bacterium]